MMDLQNLRGALRAATKGSPELDAEIALHADAPLPPFGVGCGFTGSIDDIAGAFAIRLPLHRWGVAQMPCGRFQAAVGCPNGEHLIAIHATAALALCLGFVMALCQVQTQPVGFA